MGSYIHLIFFSVLAFLNDQTLVMAGGCMHNMKTENLSPVNGIIGAIVDYSTRIGKEDTVAMGMALEDFYNQTKKCLVLQIQDSQGEAVKATLAARYLISKKQVQAILGPRSWKETSVVAEVGSQYHIPILSLADSCPSWATKYWPFLIQASPSKNLQMKAVAAIVESWGWRRVNVIYEDKDSAVNGITPHLHGALQEVGAQISHLTALPTSATAALLSEELEKLKKEQCRVFVVHASLPLALSLFSMAKEMRMMDQGYVWITTDSITSLVHSMNFSTILTMQGVLGVESYYDDKGLRYQDFYGRFLHKFRFKYPEEKNHEPGSSALEAYEAMWTAALAMEEGGISHQHLLDKLSITDFNGLGDQVKFFEQRLAPVKVFQIINIVGRSYRELGFWSDRMGFSVVVGDTAQHNTSMEILGQIFWPGGSLATPKGWDIPTAANPLRVGVVNTSIITAFVNVEYDLSSKSYSFSGFSIDIFRETIKRLPYALRYNFIYFEGTFDALVEQIYLKNFDAAVGDIAIVSNRYSNAYFTHPHTESGLVLIVPIKSESNEGWLFLKPFTKAMWFLTASINVYNGFVIWMIERNYCSELKGNFMNQIGTLLWLAFATLFSSNGGKLHSNLSRMTTVVWLFVSLIISQSYTANLTSVLTVPRLEPKVANIEALRNSKQVVGYSRKSFVKSYLLDVLRFNPNNIRSFSTFEECAEDLRSGKIDGALVELPTANLFLAKYCKSFVATGPTYKFGGYGYAFPKGSPLLPDIDEALLKVFESGALKDLEDQLTASEKCVEAESDKETLSLSPSSFCVLFLFTGCTSTVVLAIYVVHSQSKLENFMPEHKGTWMMFIRIMVKTKHWRGRKIRFLRKVSNDETPGNHPTSSSSHESIK